MNIPVPDQSSLPDAPVTAAQSKGPASSAQRAGVPRQPRIRTPTVLTPAQRAVFERALARRNAARVTGAASDTTLTDGPDGRGRKKASAPASRPSNTGSGSVSSSEPARSRSLSELAGMATTKRPLTGPGLHSGRRPKLAVFAVGSGLAALLIGVLTFELLRTPAVEPMPRATLASIRPFSPSATLAGDRAEGSAPQFPAAAPQQTAASEAVTPPDTQAQTFDPDTQEPMHNGPPLGMIALHDSN
jgi:hypothetical protein